MRIYSLRSPALTSRFQSMLLLLILSITVNCLGVRGKALRTEESFEHSLDARSNEAKECMVFGNPSASFLGSKQKFVTFDCLVHQFQGSCEYILARDCAGSLFDIHIENDSPLRNAIRTAWASGVAIRSDGLGVIRAIFAHGKTTVTMNDKSLTWPSTNYGDDGSRVLLSSNSLENRVEIVLASIGVKILLVDQRKIVVSVPPSFKTRMCGLCGNYNDNPDDDLELRSGEYLIARNEDDNLSAISFSTYQQFGISWAAVGQERLILDNDDTCRDLIEPPYCDELPEHRTRVEEFCHVLIDPRGPFADCHLYTDPDFAYKQCVMAGCLHRGSRTHTCSMIRSYQLECQRCNKMFFSKIVPECYIPCPILEVPVRGYKVGNSNSFGDVVSFFCNQGFSLSGSNTRTCQLDGTWNGDSAVCTDIDECLSGAHTCEITNGDCENTIGSYECSCKPGYQGDGRTCILQTYSVEGTVIDVSTGKVIPNTLVSLGSFASTGSDNIKTGESGKFVFQVGAGNYTIKASKKHYISNSRNVSVSHNIENVSEANVFLSKNLGADTWKIVIGWGKPNLDLDAYLRLPTGDYVLINENGEVTQDRVVDYDTKKLFYKSSNATLDIDNRTAYGIETITLNQGFVGGEYEHFVHVYEKDRSFSEGRGWAELYNGKDKKHRILSPQTDRRLKYWHTFSIDNEKRMYKVVNSLDSSPPSS